MKVNKQGVRDLNGYQMDGRQLNGRRRREKPCFHEWEHARDCSGCDGEDLLLGVAFVHTDECRKCGARRR